MRKWIQAPLLLLVLGGSFVGQAAAAVPRQTVPVQLAADLTCFPDGGVEVTFTNAVEGEPGTSLSGRVLVLQAEVWFEGHDGVVRRCFWFPACIG